MIIEHNHYYIEGKFLHMKVLVVSLKNRTVYNFRGDLIKEIISKGHEVIVAGPDRIDVDKIYMLGAIFFEIPMDKNGVNPFKDIEYKKRIEKLIDKEKPDIVFCYTVKPVIYGTLAAKKRGVKNIFPMITGMGYAFVSETFKAKLLKLVITFLYKHSLKHSSRVIFQNPDDLDYFVKGKIVSEDKCFLVNGSGVNMDRFSKAPLPKKMVFFMLSRIMNNKGVKEYLSAAEKVKKLYPEVEFRLLGAIENIQDSLEESQIDCYVKKGIIKYFPECSDVVPYYHDCSVFVLPSYREGTPRSVLEAMSCGRAIITTDAPGCRETVKDGVNGFLVPVKNVDVLVQKMILFIENPILVESMGEESYKYCREKFEIKKVNRCMLEIMEID